MISLAMSHSRCLCVSRCSTGFFTLLCMIWLSLPEVHLLSLWLGVEIKLELQVTCCHLWSAYTPKVPKDSALCPTGTDKRISQTRCQDHDTHMPWCGLLPRSCPISWCHHISWHPQPPVAGDPLGIVPKTPFFGDSSACLSCECCVPHLGGTLRTKVHQVWVTPAQPCRGDLLGKSVCEQQTAFPLLPNVPG